MPAHTKQELHDVTVKEFAKLRSLMDVIPRDAAVQKRAEDTSIKDVIGHRAHWIDLFLGWYTDGLAGKNVHFPAEGYKWSDLKRYNADLRVRQADLDWDAAKQLLIANHARLLEFVATHSNNDLYAAPMKGAKNAWTPGRWAEAAGPSHYRSASKFIRAALRASG